jgi:hypothetical protein
VVSGKGYGTASVQLLYTHTHDIHTHGRVLHTHTLYIMMQIHIPRVSTQPIPAQEFIWALRSKERVQVFTAGNVLYRYPYSDSKR